MINFTVGLIAFVVIFGSALLGMLAARRLPGHHLSTDTRTAVSAAAAVVGTLSALVLGLMVSTASGVFATASNEVTQISVDLIRMDRLLRRYGPEADGARADLRAYVATKTGQLFPAPGARRPTDAAAVGMLEALQTAVVTLAPANPLQTWLRSEALGLSDDMARSRWLLAQLAGEAIPTAFLVLLIFWLAIVFAGVGLFSPTNGTAIAAVCLCSLAVAGGIAMILELESPFTGLVRISPAPMLRALAETRS